MLPKHPLIQHPVTGPVGPNDTRTNIENPAPFREKPVNAPTGSDVTQQRPASLPIAKQPRQ